ncbi:hypothetical protein [Hugonella massiliensis]|uniref:hypothetical protein n=1 Tax=Hugonella massiliensis TaxID=1720315 RepID=UPI00232A3802|nr:hypothetical protein [Hugonella massiliensis]
MSCQMTNKNRLLSALKALVQGPIVSSARNEKTDAREGDLIMKNVFAKNLIASAPMAVAAIAMVASVIA